MRTPVTGPVIAALTAALALGATGCASGSGGSSSSREDPAAQELPDAQSGIGTLTIDVISSRFRLDYIETVSPVSDTVSAIVEEVWNHVPQAYVDLGIPIGGVNPQARLLGNTSFQARGKLGDVRISELLNCGRTMTGSIANQFEITFRVLTQVEEADGKSLVSSVVDAIARPKGVSGNTVECSSTGRLENEIVDRVRAHLVGID